jgi:signal transduction histidine kinase
MSDAAGHTRKARGSRDPRALLRPREADGSLDLLRLLTALALFSAVAVTLVWLLTSSGEFWPAWVWLGLAIPFALYLAVVRSRGGASKEERAYLLHQGLSVATIVVVVFVWLASGPKSAWVAWPIAALAALFFLHYLIRPPAPDQSRALSERVDELTRTRRGALDAQTAELRRIERDLHDGAQARLVALSMQLGRAEQRLGAAGDADEQTLALVRGAREEATLAIAELRDLSRGIAPPVLVDRGLAAAVDALGRRAPVEVTVEAQIHERPPPVVESAAYFVVAEALTNVVKHSPQATVHITLRGDHRTLRIVVADDGIGAADPDGGGLTGLRQRVGALDGTLLIVSPAGHGTTLTAELPCAS